MSDTIEVEPAQYHAASQVFGGTVSQQLASAVSGLQGSLSGTSGMAGTDPAGSKWADAYDPAANAAVGAMVDAANSCHRLAAMLQATGFNHGAADAASDPTRRMSAPADNGDYSGADPFSGPAPTLPSAHGGSTPQPRGWTLIQNLVGYVWPNGEPEKLRAAAQAWSAAAGRLSAAANAVPEALQAVRSQQSPEVEHALTVCQAMMGHIQDTAESCNQLSASCSELAEHIQQMHQAVIDELISLVEWTVAIEVAGAVAILISAGLSEAAAQAAVAARCAATAARVAAIIGRFVQLATAVAARVAGVATRIGEVAQRLKTLLRLRPLRAATKEAKALTEIAEAERAATLSRLNYAERQVQAKFKHAKDFGVEGSYNAGNAAKYREALEAFAKDPANTVKTGTYLKQPATLIYNAESRLCQVLKPDGSFWTGWKLSPGQLKNVIERGSLGGG